MGVWFLKGPSFCSNHIWKGHDTTSKVERPSDNSHFQSTSNLQNILINEYYSWISWGEVYGYVIISEAFSCQPG